MKQLVPAAWQDRCRAVNSRSHDYTGMIFVSCLIALQGRLLCLIEITHVRSVCG